MIYLKNEIVIAVIEGRDGLVYVITIGNIFEDMQSRDMKIMR